ncbi:MAG: hypothetical protein QOG31_1865 [Thermoplasmata archaeon]|jgi:hypothetical protein|nr:hypothetical protein [Thermoplasmata archaeon]
MATIMVLGTIALALLPTSQADQISIYSQSLPGETTDHGRYGFGFTWDGTTGYLFAGYASGEGRLSDILRYTASSGTFTPMGAHFWTYVGPVAAAQLGGTHYIFGVQDNDEYQTPNRIVRYDAATDQLTNLTARIPRPCAPHAVSTGSAIYLYGCYDQVAGQPNTYRLYQFDGNGLNAVASNGPYQLGSDAVWTGQYIYFFGGTAAGVSGTTAIHRFDPATNSIALMQGRTDSVESKRSCWDGRFIFSFGGANAVGPTDTISKYDVAADTLTIMAGKLPTSRSQGGAFYYQNHCYYMGGSDSTYTQLSQRQVLQYAATPNAPALRDAYLGPGPGRVTVAWNPIPSNTYGSLDEQRVYRTPTSGGTLTQVGTLTNPTATSFEDTSGPAGSVQYYRVSGYDATYGEGPKSTELAAIFRATTPQTPANEVDLAIRGSTVVAVAKDYSLTGNLGAGPCGENQPGGQRVWGGVYRSLDGGRTWTQGFFAGAPAAGGASYQCMSDPVVAFGLSGTLYFVGLAYAKPAPAGAPSPSALVFGASTNAGQSWSFTKNIVEGNDKLMPDKPMIAIDPTDGSIWVTWGLATVLPAGGAERIQPMVAHSTDEGRTWVITAVGAREGWLAHPAVDRSGALYATMTAPDPGNACGGDCIVVRKSTDKGRTFMETVVAAAKNRPPPGSGTSGDYSINPFATLAIDMSGGPRDGTLYAAWNDWIPGPPGTGQWRLTVATSVNHGSTWNVLPPPVFNAGSHQVLPRVSVSPSSIVGILYYDDPGTAAAPADVTVNFMASRDGAVSWDAPIQVSVPFATAGMRGQVGEVFLGDYVGLQWGSDGLARAAWADGRNGGSDVYFTKIKPVT